MPSPVRLTPAFLQIMLSVAREPQHGYAIMQEVQDRTSGSVRLGPGSLYWAIKRLVDAGLLREVKTPMRESTKARRRYYGLTKDGRSALTRELQVLADIVGFAESHDLVRRPKTR